jgi:hypothetical protein
MEPDGSVPCSQEPLAGLYSETDQSSPYRPAYLSKIHFNFIHPSTSWYS